MIARLVGERELVEPVELRHQVLEVAREAGQQVVHHLVGEEGAAPVGLAAQGRADLGSRRAARARRHGPSRGACAGPRARGRSTGGTGAGGDHAGAARGGVDEERERGLLLRRVERVGIVDDEPVALAAAAHGSRRRRREPGRPAGRAPRHARRPHAADASCRCPAAPRGRPAARPARARAGGRARRRWRRAGSSRTCAPAPARSRAGSASSGVEAALRVARRAGAPPRPRSARSPAARSARRRSRTGGRTRTGRR